MDPMRQYEIAFVGLKEGVHKLRFEIDDQFFSNFEASIVNSGNVVVDLAFEKHPSFFLLDFHLNGKLMMPCDRCAVDLEYPIDAEQRVVVKFDDHREGDHDDSMGDVIHLSKNATHLNTAQLIYEFISLSVPVNHINCDNIIGNKPCDEKVLEQLRHSAEQAEHPVDHRWDDLNKIKFN